MDKGFEGDFGEGGKCLLERNFGNWFCHSKAVLKTHKRATCKEPVFWLSPCANLSHNKGGFMPLPLPQKAGLKVLCGIGVGDFMAWLHSPCDMP